MSATHADLVRRRTRTQRLSTSEFRSAPEVVGWLGAVQAQDYAGAKWAVALRAPGLTDADLDRAFSDGTILRTHVLRPTWHFVTPADIRWMLSLTAPRVHRFNASMYRTVELDAAVFARSRKVIERALGDGQQLTRTELQAALADGGIAASGMRLAYMVMQAELDQVICSGGRRGKQFTYALLDARAPRARILTLDEALAELTSRYFSSHGPATLKDFAWWSGLTMREGRKGIEMVRRALVNETVGELTYWSAAVPSAPSPLPDVHLLPNYDECLIAYKDRGTPVSRSATRGPDPFAHHLVVDGRLAGSWSRSLVGTTARIEVVPYGRIVGASRRALSAVADRYGRFMNGPVKVSLR